ncbi:helix-turn-helix domain-containing protein [Bacillus sp. Marseille-P3800]|uniref:helix-turn-helix domain-containing protein n=1 Tax=Bacillus sp. Marseille-P3800 TaxID=2014782 RepID=UPI000C06D447|nr:XRE family transcriptional regulator [Bacillus sp. Marseille-P3800]
MESFNGERLKEARIFRGVTLVELSEKIGITKQMISKYENAKAIPSFEILTKIIMYLNFPKEFFYEEDKVTVKIGNTYFRSLFTTSKREQQRQQYPLKVITSVKAVLDEYVDFPQLNLPELVKDNKEMDRDIIEKSANDLREFWGLNLDEPIHNMVQLLEKNGFIVSAFNIESTDIDAFCRKQFVNGKDSYTISLAGNRFAVRRRFNAGHELGHVILHESFIDLEEISKEQHKRIEQEAHSFSSAFLLPKDAFIKDIGTHPTDLQNYIYYKRKWKVSISAMVIRAYNLGLINNTQYQTLQRKINSNGWKKIEPLDKELGAEVPNVINQAINLLIDNQILTGEELVKEISSFSGLSIYPEEIERILGLKKGLLRKKDIENVVPLKIK